MRKIVVLKAKTRKGKNVITSFGETWVVVEERSNFQPQFKTTATGPWVLIAPSFIRVSREDVRVGAKNRGREFRWVSIQDDPNFEVDVRTDPLSF